MTEAINHAMAFDYVLTLATKPINQISESLILDIHQRILSKIDDAQAGRYRSESIRIAGSRVVLPNPAKVSTLMAGFIAWLTKIDDAAPTKAIQAHLRLVTIHHPFTDGNGRTARLLMNLILLLSGYPPAIIRPKDRLAYLSAIEQA